MQGLSVEDRLLDAFTPDSRKRPRLDGIIGHADDDDDAVTYLGTHDTHALAYGSVPIYDLTGTRGMEDSPYVAASYYPAPVSAPVPTPPLAQQATSPIVLDDIYFYQQSPPVNGGGYVEENSPQYAGYSQPMMPLKRPASVVHLDSSDDNDNDLVIVSSRPLPPVPNQSHGMSYADPYLSRYGGRPIEVFYGMVDSGTITGHSLPRFHSADPDVEVKLKVHESPDSRVWAYDSSGQPFGVVDDRTASALASLLRHGYCRVQAYVSNDVIRSSRGNRYNTMTYSFRFNLYGPQSKAVGVEGHLLKCQIYYSNPDHRLVDEDVIWVAHAQRQLSEEEVYSYHQEPVRMPLAPVYTVQSTTQAIPDAADEINKLFNSLQNSDSLPETDPDSSVLTPLLKHQKQGLTFMTRKERPLKYNDQDPENASLWKKVGHGWRHMLTKETIKERPHDVLGGILADEMGVGKTLQILCLVAGSLDEARDFADRPPDAPPLRHTYDIADPELRPHPTTMVSKTTLLVCPLSTMGNWEEQIKTHLSQTAVKYLVYHGKRKADPAHLAQYDLVITTYSVVGQDYKRHLADRDGFFGPLQKTYFFRVVLDEAHAIRGKKTLQSQAIVALQANRRWAVTGTPVQNRIDDILPLFKFLRLEPYNDSSVFDAKFGRPCKKPQFITTETAQALRTLIDSITLRRLKSLIDLPKKTIVLEKLEFSEAERAIYNNVQGEVLRRIAAATALNKGKFYHSIFQVLLVLRMICAHGKELLGTDDMTATAQLMQSDTVDLSGNVQKSVRMPAYEAYRTFRLLQEAEEHRCALCRVPLEQKAQDDSGSDSDDKDAKFPILDTLGYMTNCSDLLCATCLPKYKKRVSQEFRLGMSAECPICKITGNIEFCELKASGLEEHEKARKKRKKDFIYRGPSTKVKALVAKLLDNRKQSKDGEIVKSIVFTSWTTHMDLIEIAFREHGISWVRLDGTMCRNQRNEAIDKLRNDPTVEVMLISIHAGGLGLNLTTASRVYMMEPLYNPAVESQALDRVYRLGQKKDVVCTRFIMADSFEEQILKLQELKNALADLTVGAGKKKGDVSFRTWVEDWKKSFEGKV